MIKNVYQSDGSNCVVVTYESGCQRTYEVDGMYYPTYHFPKTVESFMENANYKHVEYDWYGYSVWTRKDDKAA